MYSENVNVKIRIKKAYTLKSVLHLSSHWSQLYFVRESEKIPGWQQSCQKKTGWENRTQNRNSGWEKRWGTRTLAGIFKCYINSLLALKNAYFFPTKVKY